MNYRMNDASFKAPEGWFDQTLYILSSEAPGKPGISLVVHSEELDSKKDSTAYKELSLGRFPLELPGFKLSHQKEITILKNTSAWILEHTWIADTGLMHHYQAVFAVMRSSGLFSEINKGYSITMSMMEALHKPELEKTFMGIVNSFNLESYGG